MALIPILLAVGYAVAFTTLTQINIGSRYLLPIVPLVQVAGVATLWRVGRSRLRTFAGALVAISCVEGLAAMPDPLSFYNVAARATGAAGHAIVDDDWGQSLIALRDWMHANGVTRIRLASPGPVDPAVYGIAFDEVDDATSTAEWTAWGDALAAGTPTYVARPNFGARWFTAPPVVARQLRDGHQDARAGTFHLYRARIAATLEAVRASE